MDIRTTSKRSWFSKYVKRGVSKYKKGWDHEEGKAKRGVNTKLHP
jgi:hypothetical protein